MSRSSFDKIKDFVKGMLKGYSISSNQTRVSLVTYGSTPVNVLQFKEGVHRSIVEQALFDMSPVGGDRKLADAVKFIAKNLFTNSLRTGKLLVLLVSGTEPQLKDTSDMKTAAMELKERNVELLVVGIGKEAGNNVRGMADPEKTIALDDVKDLKSAYPKVFDESGKAAGILLIFDPY